MNYEEISKRVAALNLPPSVLTKNQKKTVPQGLRVENSERSRFEVLDFIANPPDKYFAYVEDTGGNLWRGGGRLLFVTTWMGDTLATVTWQGFVYRSPAFGRSSERVNFRCVGINGVTYSGTYYKSSGNYCRLKRIKEGKQ